MAVFLLTRYEAHVVCRAAFEIVALAAGRLGSLPLAAQSVIMTTDQSACLCLSPHHVSSRSSIFSSVMNTIPFGIGMWRSTRGGVGLCSFSRTRTRNRCRCFCPRGQPHRGTPAQCCKAREPCVRPPQCGGGSDCHDSPNRHKRCKCGPADS